jgi:YVTN family beta-propeller protein
LAAGTYSIVATFTPTNSAAYAASTSATLTETVANPVYAYVTNYNDGTVSVSVSVSVIATATSTVTDTIATGFPLAVDAEGVAVTPNGAYAYVTNAASDPISVISTSTNTVIGSISYGETSGVAVTPNGAYIYAVSPNYGAVLVRDGRWLSGASR